MPSGDILTGPIVAPESCIGKNEWQGRAAVAVDQIERRCQGDSDNANRDRPSPGPLRARFLQSGFDCEFKHARFANAVRDPSQ
jgi:hypothetical protein